LGVDLVGVERVGGGGVGEPNGNGPATRMYRYGKVVFFIAVPYDTLGIRHRSATVLYKGSVTCERSPL
jgi:hypothetical protein